MTFHIPRPQRVQRTLRASLGRAVLKATLVTGFVVSGYVGASVVADLAPQPRPHVPAPDLAAQLMLRHGCSTTGLGDVIPGSALVSRDGNLVHVTFEEGWSVHEGRAAGTLVAVCRDELPKAHR